jgi:hypothetical protein
MSEEAKPLEPIPANTEPEPERLSQAEFEALVRGDPNAPKVPAAEIMRRLPRKVKLS